MGKLSLVPSVLKWARERSNLDTITLSQKMKVSTDAILEWEETGELSFARAKKLAHYTFTPLGYLFLPAPQDDKLPIPDFRTITDQPLLKPSPNLLETIQIMQQRQLWMREFLIENQSEKFSYLGHFSLKDSPKQIAADMRRALDFNEDWANRKYSWQDALRELRLKIEQLGIMIFINGIVGNNTHRKLDPDEFRGFILCDEYAPLIFINGADAKSAQMFTIAHELAHIWIGQEGVSNISFTQTKLQATEIFCNSVAAEFLVPEDNLKEIWEQAKSDDEPFQFIARRYKVSPIVAARRSLDLNFINRDYFFEFYEEYSKDERRKRNKRSGGDFWKSQNVKLGLFGTAVVLAAKQGRLLYRDAYRLTGLKSTTFENYAKNIGIPIK